MAYQGGERKRERWGGKKGGKNKKRRKKYLYMPLCYVQLLLKLVSYPQTAQKRETYHVREERSEFSALIQDRSK